MKDIAMLLKYPYLWLVHHQPYEWRYLSRPLMFQTNLLNFLRDHWHYLQVVKVRDDYHRVTALKPRLVWGKALQAKQPLAPNVAYIERTHLTSRLMNARLARKSLRFSKRLQPLISSAFWCDMVYNLVHPHKSLRLPSPNPPRRWFPCSPAMTAGLTDHLWSIRELLSVVPLFTNSP